MKKSEVKTCETRVEWVVSLHLKNPVLISKINDIPKHAFECDFVLLLYIIKNDFLSIWLYIKGL